MKGLTLNAKEQQRLQVLNQVLERRLEIAEAAMRLGVSERHTWRLLAAYREEGAAALAHGNRGRPAWNRCSDAVRERVVALAREPRYAGCNHTHFSELLGEREGLHLSRPTVRRLLGAAGLPSRRKRRSPKHRSRRERMPQEGGLLQWDGSPHDWLEGRGPRLTLIGAIDDATGRVAAARFRLQEDAQGYLVILRDILRTKGIPVAIYHDGHGIFRRSERDRWSLDEELAGERLPTQVGRALAELGIRSIEAHSAQAKGRIERLWQTWQDRLIIELRLAGACTLEEADALLQAYLPRFAQRFQVPAAKPGSAYRPLPPELDLETVCCFKYQRTVGKDHVIRLQEHRLQIQRDGQRSSYARAKVEVHERLDGSLVVYHQGHCLLVKPAPEEAPLLRARQGQRVAALPKPGTDQVGATDVAGPAVKQPTRLRFAPAEPQVSAHSSSDQILGKRGDKPPRPGPNHPWRKSWGKGKQLTKSLNT